MTMRCLLMSAAAVVALSAPGALAADMAEWPVDTAPVACGSVASERQADDVYLPPQPAYIVAERCGPPVKNWLSLLGAPRHEDILVYYNGGSMDRTDITLIRVPR